MIRKTCAKIFLLWILFFSVAIAESHIPLKEGDFVEISKSALASDKRVIPEKPDNYVSDYSNLLSAEEIVRLNTTLKDYEQRTSHQLFVAIFPGKLTETIEDFSVRLEEKWKVGQKGKDNGILLVIFPEDRQLRIEVGYGLEGVIPDSVANAIIQNSITPAFKDKRYGEGITSGVNEIMKAAQGEFFSLSAGTMADSAINTVSSTSEKLFTQLFDNKYAASVVMLLFIAALIFTVRYTGPLAGFGFSVVQFGLGFGVLAWLGVFILYVIVYQRLSEKYRYADSIGFWAGGLKNFGNGPSSGGSSGGSSSGGGFGGGGGGSSGGGGASGRW